MQRGRASRRRGVTLCALSDPNVTAGSARPCATLTTASRTAASPPGAAVCAHAVCPRDALEGAAHGDEPGPGVDRLGPAQLLGQPLGREPALVDAVPGAVAERALLPG